MVLRTLPLLGLALVTLGCSGAAEVPSIPDLAALRAQYDQPSAEFDETMAHDALMMHPELTSLASGMSAFDSAGAGVDDASAAAGTETGSGIDLQGSIHVVVRCPGDLDSPVYDAGVNGDLSITLAVDSTRILRAIAGRAEHCVARQTYFGKTVRVSMDGPFSIDLGRDIGLGQSRSASLLFSIDGQIEVDDYDFTKVTGRLSQRGFEYLLTLGEESVILLVLADGVVGVRDKDGTWRCNVSDLACARD